MNTSEVYNENSQDKSNNTKSGSIFKNLKKKISNLFFISDEDGQEKSIEHSNINEIEHYYDAPSLYYFDNQQTGMSEKGSREFNKYQQPQSDKNNRRFSQDSSKINGIKKKINPVIKVATYITNKKFTDKRKNVDDALSYSSKNSAFKILENPYKRICLDSQKIINYNDFFDILKDKNLIKPVPIKKTLNNEDFRINKKRDREEEKNENEFLMIGKKQRQNVEQNDSSISNLNMYRNFQRDNVSMHSINSVLSSKNEAFRKNQNDDVSMSFKINSQSSFTSHVKPKTLDDIKREIEEKRSNNKKMIDQISMKCEKRNEWRREFDYEERKKLLSNYHKEKEKISKELELLPNINLKNNSTNYIFDTTRDRNFSLTKSSISIPSTIKKESIVVVEKKENINIIPIKDFGLPTGICNQSDLKKSNNFFPSLNNSTIESREKIQSALSLFDSKNDKNNLDTENEVAIKHIEKSKKLSESIENPVEKNSQKSESDKLFGSIGVINTDTMFKPVTETTKPSVILPQINNAQQSILFSEKPIYHIQDKSITDLSKNLLRNNEPTKILNSSNSFDILKKEEKIETTMSIKKLEFKTEFNKSTETQQNEIEDSKRKIAIPFSSIESKEKETKSIFPSGSLFSTNTDTKTDTLKNESNETKSIFPSGSLFSTNTDTKTDTLKNESNEVKSIFPSGSSLFSTNTDNKKEVIKKSIEGLLDDSSNDLKPIPNKTTNFSVPVGFENMSNKTDMTKMNNNQMDINTIKNTSTNYNENFTKNAGSLNSVEDKTLPSTSLYNSNNPFIQASNKSINPNNNSLFGNFPMGSTNSSNLVINKESHISSSNNLFTQSTINPAKVLNYNDNDNSMAISPITSPKTVSRSEMNVPEISSGNNSNQSKLFNNAVFGNNTSTSAFGLGTGGASQSINNQNLFTNSIPSGGLFGSQVTNSNSIGGLIGSQTSMANISGGLFGSQTSNLTTSNKIMFNMGKKS